jgi:lipoprotein-anchoring transpeptidase ErfK/SrfK
VAFAFSVFSLTCICCNSVGVLYLQPPYKARKPGFFQTFTNLFYAVLCVALCGFFVWVWWPSGSARQPVSAPVATPAKPPPPVVAPAQQIDARALMASNTRPVQTILEAQIALVRQGISPGSIDGVAGSQTRSALIAFQEKQGIAPSGLLDADTKAALLISLPAMTEYTVTAEDLARLLPVSKTWLGKSEQPRMDFENIVELLGEKAFSHPQLIRALNPNVNWTNLTAGTTVIIPQVQYPPAAGKAALVKISLQQCVLEAFDDQSNLMVHFPCSIGRLAEKRPAGELHVATLALDPNYTFDPDVFPESAEARELGRKLIIPPGPNNPVGVAWIGLDRPGYGIHGTPAPEQVGRTESHGCFRLANWNAAFLARLVWIGMPVQVE